MSALAQDAVTVREMKDALTRHLHAALYECSTLARKFQVLDADEVLVEIRSYFDPTENYAEQSLDEAFHEADKATNQDAQSEHRNGQIINARADTRMAAE